MRFKASPIAQSLIAIFLIALCNYSAADSMVMIVASDSGLLPLSRLQLRKIYLGIPVRIDDKPLVPLVNHSNSALTEQFHRNIVGMAKSSYDRKLMRNRLNYAADPPQVYNDQEKLFKALAANKQAIGYAWQSKLEESTAPLKVLQVIWHQN